MNKERVFQISYVCLLSSVILFGIDGAIITRYNTHLVISTNPNIQPQWLIDESSPFFLIGEVSLIIILISIFASLFIFVKLSLNYITEGLDL